MARKICITTIFFLLLVPGLLYGAEKFGLVFDVTGEAVIKSATGETTKLDRKKHLLRPVREGDTVEVKRGRVLIVSLKDKQGYEILSDSAAVIKDKELKTLKGKVNVKEGYSAPGAGIGDPMGGVVLRSIHNLCITMVSPVSTAVLALTPDLKWKLYCEGVGKRVFVTVLHGRDILLDVTTEKDSIKVPEGTLKYGQTYKWIVDGGLYGIAGGTFSIPEQDEVNRIKKDIGYYSQVSELPRRLSYIFYLLNNGLNEFAKPQIEKLQEEYPENEYVQAMK